MTTEEPASPLIMKDKQSIQSPPKAVLGMLFGMVVGIALASLFHGNVNVGLGTGMWTGVACGYCADTSQPKRGRIGLAVFSFILVASLFLIAVS